jgi:hypothetical protein
MKYRKDETKRGTKTQGTKTSTSTVRDTQLRQKKICWIKGEKQEEGTSVLCALDLSRVLLL